MWLCVFTKNRLRGPGGDREKGCGGIWALAEPQRQRPSPRRSPAHGPRKGRVTEASLLPSRRQAFQKTGLGLCLLSLKDLLKPPYRHPREPGLGARPGAARPDTAPGRGRNAGEQLCPRGHEAARSGVPPHPALTPPVVLQGTCSPPSARGLVAAGPWAAGGL